MFTEPFCAFVCPGDAISCEVDGLVFTARVHPDDCPDAPDQRQDGFWPSLYKDAPGFIGPGNDFRARFVQAQAEAEAIMESWRRGDWFYCGIIVLAAANGVEIAPHAASLWGIEANYPGSDNTSLSDIANELLPDAVIEAQALLARLAALAPHDPKAPG